jgi:hypothetical protein
MLLLGNVQAGQDGAGVAVSQAQPVALVAAPRAQQPSVAKVSLQDCSGLGTPVECFTRPDSTTSRYLNVASFFDKRARSLDTHFFLKYFDNAAKAVVEINGLGMHVRYDNDATRTLPAVGVLKTSQDAPLLPPKDALTNLQVVGVEAEPDQAETCVEFDEPVRIEADEAAWLVVRFPAAAAQAFFGLLVDADATDLDCDFMTPDAGEYYYRPDPLNGPPFDWAITAYTTPVTSKELLSEVPWSQWKQLYRDAGNESTH